MHTKVGDTCIGAVINNREVPLRRQLSNGDVVKIIRGGEPEAQPGWENIVVTGKARSALRRLTRTGEAEEFRRIGMMLVDHAFAREGKNFGETVLVDTLKRLNFDTTEDLFEALGSGHISLSNFMTAVFPGREETETLSDFVNRDIIDDETVQLYVLSLIHISEPTRPY